MRFFTHIFIILILGITTQCFAAETIDQSLPASDVSSVNIENLRGLVTVIGWDKQQIQVQGELDEQAEKFIFEQQGAQVNIKVVMPHQSRGHWQGDGSELTINMPTSVRMTFSGVSSDVVLQNLAQGVEAKTVSGNIKASALSRHIELGTVSGDIKANDMSGKIQMGTVSGDIEDTGSEGRLQLQAVSGNVESDSSAKEVVVNTVSGNIDLNLHLVDELEISSVSGNSQAQMQLNDNGTVKLSSVSGDLRVQFQQQIQANFRLTANAGGELINKLTSDKAKHAKYGPGSKLNFSTGNGNSSVRASTVSGNIRVSSK